MQMESFVGGVTGGFETKPIVRENTGNSVSSVEHFAEEMEITPVVNSIQSDTEARQEERQNPSGQEKEPAKSSIDAAMSLLNSQIEKTHCAYSYDEESKRISIKVFDDETDELIREVPPEKSLEALKKIWEIAGIIIDEKR